MNCVCNPLLHFGLPTSIKLPMGLYSNHVLHVFLQIVQHAPSASIASGSLLSSIPPNHPPVDTGSSCGGPVVCSGSSY